MLSQAMNNMVVGEVVREAVKAGVKGPVANAGEEGPVRVVCPQSGRTFAIELREILENQPDPVRIPKPGRITLGEAQHLLNEADLVMVTRFHDVFRQAEVRFTPGGGEGSVWARLQWEGAAGQLASASLAEDGSEITFTGKTLELTDEEGDFMELDIYLPLDATLSHHHEA